MGMAGAVIGAGVISAGAGMAGSAMASGAASDAASGARDLSMLQYSLNRGDLAPYNEVGVHAIQGIDWLNREGWTIGQPNYLDMAASAMPGNMSQAELEATPGYKFNLSQGLQSTQNAAAARGLGVSGAALKGAATYATGLADSTYQNQFNNALQRTQGFVGLNSAQQGNTTNRYNRMMGAAQIGENSAAQTGNTGATLVNQAGNALIAGGNAQAAGYMGAGNAISGALNSGMSNYLMYQGMQGTGSVNGGVAQTGYYPQPANSWAGVQA